MYVTRPFRDMFEKLGTRQPGTKEISPIWQYLACPASSKVAPEGRILCGGQSYIKCITLHLSFESFLNLCSACCIRTPEQL